LFEVVWYIVGLLVLRAQGIEETVEFAHAYETDVADFHSCIWFPWTWVPQGMTIRRKCNPQLFAKDVVFGHYALRETKKFSTRVGRREKTKGGEMIGLITTNEANI
jgi:hypothetical protein